MDRSSLPARGNPNTSVIERDARGAIIRRRFYGADGIATLAVAALEAGRVGGASMVHDRDHVAGWMAGSIHDFMKVFPDPSDTLAYALISRLDSGSDVVSLLGSSDGHAPLVGAGRRVGRGLLVPTRRLLEVHAADRVFFGFDEVWFFPTDAVPPKPESASLVGPRRIDQGRLDALGSWLVESSCSLALGDGAGLNVLVKARGLVRHLLAFSLDQPEPAVRPAFEEEPWDPGGVGT